jgi:hypothetical protein
MAAASRINKNVNICRDKVLIKNKEEKFTRNVPIYYYFNYYCIKMHTYDADAMCILKP